jgi:glycosyltransferase involved in cell wall biosynthesis
MRFCMVTTFYPPRHFGGDAIYVRALSRALVRAGHHVEVVCSDDAYRAAGGRADDDAPGDEDDGVVVHRLRDPLGRLAALWAHQAGTPGPAHGALAAILDAGFDVIHYHNVSLVGGPAVLSMGRARTKLMTLHDHWLVCPMHVLWKDRERACDAPTCVRCSIRSHRPPQLWRYGPGLARGLAHVDALLAPSDWCARRHRDGGIDRPIEKLPLYSRFDGRATALPAAARPRFLYVGRVTASKGVRPLVERFAATPDLELVVAGDGDLREALAATFASSANLRFAGAVDGDTLASLYASATATLVPSLAPESFGLVAVESFAFGTPVVALDAGGLGEVVRESGGGLVCAGLDGMVDAARRLAADPALRDTLGGRARAAYEARYTEARHVDAYLACANARVVAH